MVKIDVGYPPPEPRKPLYPRLMQHINTGSIYMAHDRRVGVLVQTSREYASLSVPNEDFDDDKVWQPLEKGTTITLTQE